MLLRPATELLSFILHLDKHLSDMIVAHGTTTYAILWTIVFCETGLVLTPFLPGDSLLFAAGAFAGESCKGNNNKMMSRPCPCMTMTPFLLELNTCHSVRTTIQLAYIHITCYIHQHVFIQLTCTRQGLAHPKVLAMHPPPRQTQVPLSSLVALPDNVQHCFCTQAWASCR